MEQSQQELEELISRRLIQNVEEDFDVKRNSEKSASTESLQGEKLAEKNFESASRVTTEESAENLERGNTNRDEATEISNAESNHPVVFTKIEKSLAALGFFTPASRRVKNEKVKRISFNREVDGKRVEVTAEIVPSALFGLPVTADQDKYLALQKMITDIQRSGQPVMNPIRFKSADLLRLLNRNTKTGKNYAEVSEWLDVMSSTTIISKGVVWCNGSRSFPSKFSNCFPASLSVSAA